VTAVTAVPPVTPPTTILVGWIGRVFWLRVEGKGTFQCSLQVKRAFQAVIQAGARDLVVDLERCSVMDSTFLGTLTYAAIAQRKRGGGSFTILNANPRNLQLLTDLGLNHVMEVDANGTAWPEERRIAGQMLAACSEPGEANQQEQARHVLEAHQSLSGLSRSNQQRFSDVIHFLEQEIHEPPQPTP
jgi:anti-anti-sigma factor